MKKAILIVLVCFFLFGTVYIISNIFFIPKVNHKVIINYEPVSADEEVENYTFESLKYKDNTRYAIYVLDDLEEIKKIKDKQGDLVSKQIDMSSECTYDDFLSEIDLKKYELYSEVYDEHYNLKEYSLLDEFMTNTSLPRKITIYN